MVVRTAGASQSIASSDKPHFFAPAGREPREECKASPVFKSRITASPATKAEVTAAKSEHVSDKDDVAQAYFKFGEIYFKGEGVERDLNLALDYFNRAAARGNTSAMYRFGMMLYYGISIRPDKKEALQWLTKAAERNHSDAQFHVGYKFYNGDVGEKDYPTACAWFKRAASQGHPGAMEMLGKLYKDGAIGVERNYKDSKVWFEMAAAARGGSTGGVNLWEIHSQGLGVEKNPVLARQWLDRAATYDTNAKLTLALFHLDERRYAAAYNIFAELGAKGNIRALRETKRMYWLGQGVKSSEDMVKKLQKQIDDADAAKIETNKGHSLRFAGEHGGALQCYLKAASMGDGASHYFLGEMHEHGMGVKKDYKVARNYFKEAAALDHGHKGTAFYALALIWERGLGVESDYKIAYKLYNDAVSTNALIYPDALFKIGRMHEQGLGVEQSDAEARKWFQRAANEGDSYARDAMMRLTPENHLESADSGDNIPAPALPKGLFDDEESDAEIEASSNPQALLVAQQKVLADKLLGLEFSLEDGNRALETYKKEYAALKAELEQSKDKDLTSLQGKQKELESLIQRETLAQQAAEERGKIFADDNLSSFYCYFQTIFNGTFLAAQALISGMLGKAAATKATKGIDSATNAVGFIEEEIVDSIPVVGGFLKRVLSLLSAPLKTYGDFERGKAVMYMASIFNGPATCEFHAEILARQLALVLHEEIRKVATSQPIGFFRKQLQKIKDLKENLLAQNIPIEIREFAEKRCEVLIIAIMTNKVKPSPDSLQVIAQLMQLILGPTFEPTVTVPLQRPEETSLDLMSSKAKPSTDITKSLQEYDARLKQLEKLKDSQQKPTADLVLSGSGDQCLALAMPESQTGGAGLSSGVVQLVYQTDARVIQLAELVALLMERLAILSQKFDKVELAKSKTKR